MQSDRAVSLSGEDLAGRGALQLAPVQVEPFDEYILIGKLGHGGMAEVFLALSQGPSGFKKLLVIKRLHQHMQDDPQLVSMFMDEARVAASLHHPNVVQTNKVGSWQGQHFLAMEFLDGQPLNRVLKRVTEQGRTLPLPLSVRIVSDALDGLHYAHEAKDYEGTPLQLIHRDISPHNVFVTYDGQVKLLDFGIAKSSIQESATRTGLIKGKFAYIAPEQARGEVVDQRADIWSMGVTLWECLAGRRLFRGSSEVAVLEAALHEEVPLLSDVQPSVPEDLARIVARCLRRDRAGRYPSALEFKEQLDEWLVTQSRAATRAALGDAMSTLFSDTIAERRALLKSCLAQVESGSGGFPSFSRVMPSMPSQEMSAASHPSWVSQSAHSHANSVSSFQFAAAPARAEAPRRSSGSWKLLALVAAVALGACLALLLPMILGEPVSQTVGVLPVVMPESGADSRGPEPLGDSDSLGESDEPISAASGDQTGLNDAESPLRIANDRRVRDGERRARSDQASDDSVTGSEAVTANSETVPDPLHQGSGGNSSAPARAPGVAGQPNRADLSGESGPSNAEQMAERDPADEAERRRARLAAQRAAEAAHRAARRTVAGEETPRSVSVPDPEPEAEVPTTVPSPTPAPREAPVAVGQGHLALDATPYAQVRLNGRFLGITPLEVDLPAGRHTLHLRAPSANIETTYSVNIVAGETVRRRIALE